jgi:hypothetical protein
MDENSHSDKPVNDNDAQVEIRQIERQNNKFKKVLNKKFTNIFNNKNSSGKVNYEDEDNDYTIKEEDYRIAISQDGKFAVTFDTGKK